MPQLTKPEPRKYCSYCGLRLHRKRYNGRLEDYGAFNRRTFCDKACMALGHDTRAVGKQGHLYRARRHRKANCEQCGTSEKLHVHHIDNDWRNDDPANLKTLCSSCHLKHHWQSDGRRSALSDTRRVPLVAIEELHGFLDEAELSDTDRITLKAIVGLFTVN